MPGEEPPKLIIDTDWKSQAQAEKEKLSQAAKPGAKPGSRPTGLSPNPTSAGTAPGPGEEDPEGESGVPREVTFKDVISIMISQALAYMGAYPDPRTGQAMVALDLAKLHIDMLGILEQKTKGNLTEEETRLLTRAVNELRLEYVDVAKMVAKAVDEGRATAMPGAGGPGGVRPVGPGTLKMPPDLRNPG